MAISKREHEAAVRKLDSLLLWHQMAMVRKPDHEAHTGRIRETSSRYALRAWFLTNGYCFAVLIHSHPGQNDHIIAAGDLAEWSPAYAQAVCPSPETYAIRELVCGASRAHSSSLQPACAQEALA